ncbi:MAG: phosphopyruvate hydratase, partial [Fervidicoccaceae archaeon]
IEILDSRGNPTLKVCLQACGKTACASVPSGASTGKNEAFELRDGERRVRGRGVRRAAANITDVVAQAIVGEDIENIRKIDDLLISIDGTENKSKIGGNAIIGVSMAAARLLSYVKEVPLYAVLGGALRRRIPTPLLNIINGGKHAGNPLSFQEFLLIPHGFSRFSDALWASVEVYFSLKDRVKEKYGSIFTSVGDEGGFAPPISEPEDALKLISESVQAAGYRMEEDFSLGIDAAASSFFSEEEKMYRVSGKKIDAGELMEIYIKLVDSYPVKLIEDPFAEDDFSMFAAITEEMRRRKTIIVGDDLLTTNVKRLRMALERRAVSAVLIKPNQVGTVSETVDFSVLALESGLKRVVSHRSGDTDDSFIADLSIAIESEGIKTGAPARGERTSKYNRLLEVEWELDGEARYAGRSLFI